MIRAESHQGCVGHLSAESEVVTSALRVVDRSAQPSEPLEPSHLVDGFFQPAEALHGSHPQSPQDVLPPGSGKVPNV